MGSHRKQERPHRQRRKQGLLTSRRESPPSGPSFCDGSGFTFPPSLLLHRRSSLRTRRCSTRSASSTSSTAFILTSSWWTMARWANTAPRSTCVGSSRSTSTSKESTHVSQSRPPRNLLAQFSFSAFPRKRFEVRWGDRQATELIQHRPNMSADSRSSPKTRYRLDCDVPTCTQSFGGILP